MSDDEIEFPTSATAVHIPEVSHPKRTHSRVPSGIPTRSSARIAKAVAVKSLTAERPLPRAQPGTVRSTRSRSNLTASNPSIPKGKGKGKATTDDYDEDDLSDLQEYLDRYEDQIDEFYFDV